MIKPIVYPNDLKKTSSPWFREVILGGQDGLVNVLGIILGITAASGQHHIIVAASLAAAFAEAVSMGAVNYTSTLAQRDFYLFEESKENKEINERPQEEKDEIYWIFYNKGFRGKFLKEVVKKISSEKDIWLKIMMEDELNLQPVFTKNLLKSSFVVGAATIVGSLVPVLPYFIFQGSTALYLSLIISGITLFFVGAAEAKSLVGSWWKSGLQMLLIGLGAALIGFFIGQFFHAN